MAIYKGMFTLMCLLFADSIGGFRISTRCGSLPQPTPTPTDAYYFGTQSLLCVLGGPALYRSSSRFSFAPWHRLIKYKNYVLEWGTNGYSINFNRSLSSQCPITWEEEPAGRSSKSINEVDDFGRMYEYYNGGYELLANNCHMFANDLSRFLTHDNFYTTCVLRRASSSGTAIYAHMSSRNPKCFQGNVFSFQEARNNLSMDNKSLPSIQTRLDEIHG